METSGPRFAPSLRGAFVGAVLAGLVAGCGAGQSAIPVDSREVPFSTPESIQVMAETVDGWIETETGWMRALIDDRIGLDEFEELSWRADESLVQMRSDIDERVDVLPDEAQTALRPVTSHLGERADAFGTMSLLYFEGSEEGWEASLRTYLGIIDPDHVGAVVDEVRADVAVAHLPADTAAAIESLLAILEQSDSRS